MPLRTPPSQRKNRAGLVWLGMGAGAGGLGAYLLAGWGLWHDLPVGLASTLDLSQSLHIHTDFFRAELLRFAATVAPWSRAGKLWPEALNWVAQNYGQAEVDGILNRFSTAWDAVPLGAAAGFLVAYFSRPAAAQTQGKDSKDVVHIRGRRLLSGAMALNAFTKTCKSEIKISGEGIKLSPNLHSISIDRETRHFFVVGSVGGGKTQAITPMLLAAKERGDRMIVLDNKGDFSSKIKGARIVSPWDERSLIWDIAADCRTKTGARELAARLIPEGNDPMWSDAARQILTGMIVKLQAERQHDWCWKDLADLFARPLTTISQDLQKHLPEASGLLGDGTGKTAQSVMVTLLSHLASIFDLADAWPRKTKGKMFSVRRWLREEGPEKNAPTIILQGSGQFATLQKAYVGALIGLASQIINSPEIGESKTRKIWFFLDELPQFGKIDIGPLIEIGRSKGVRVVIGAQDVAQLKETYNNNTAESWLSMIGTHIICRINPGPTADSISKNVGDREIERRTRTWSTQGVDPSPIKQGGSFSLGWQRETVPVILPAELQSKLGPGKSGINMLLLGVGDDALILTAPYTSLKNFRAASILADWTNNPVGASEALSIALAEQPPADPPPPLPPAPIRLTPEPQQQPEPEQKQEQEHEQQKEADPLNFLNQDKQPETEKGDGIGQEVADTQVDDAASEVLDAIAPGAGMALEIAKTVGEVFAEPTGPIVVTQQRPSRFKKREAESEIEAD